MFFRTINDPIRLLLWLLRSIRNQLIIQQGTRIVSNLRIAASKESLVLSIVATFTQFIIDPPPCIDIFKNSKKRNYLSSPFVVQQEESLLKKDKKQPALDRLSF